MPGSGTLGLAPAFVAAVILMACSPGPALALVLRRGLHGGAAAAMPTIAGLTAGLYGWALLAAGGVAAIIANTEGALVALRVGGVLVVAGLGWTYLRTAWRARDHGGLLPLAPKDVVSIRASQAFTQGLLVQLANPQAAIFMMSFYPQFIPPDRPLLATTAALAASQVVIEVCVLAAVAAGARRASGTSGAPLPRRWLDALTGTVLIALAVHWAIALL